MSLKLQGLENVVRIPDWRLTTAELLYHLPDHPHVLQSFIWQKLDRAPDFPELGRFLVFWEREIDGSQSRSRSDGKSECVKMLAKQRGRAGCVNPCERNTL
jgi:uncharacterized protein Usg